MLMRVLELPISLLGRANCMLALVPGLGSGFGAGQEGRGICSWRSEQEIQKYWRLWGKGVLAWMLEASKTCGDQDNFLVCIPLSCVSDGWELMY